MKLTKSIFSMILVFAVANIALWFWTAGSYVDRSVPDNNRRVDIPNIEKDRGQYGILGDIDSGMLSGLSSPSLQMKENVDFFLTPALLVQESISENVIISYPGE